QELSAEVAPVLRDEFPHQQLTIEPEGPGVGMAARRPVSWEELPMPGRSAVVATLQPADWPEFTGPVEVIAIHLTNPIAGFPWTTTRARRGQLMAIEKRLETSAVARRVLCGDLNATPMWPAHRRLLRLYRDGVLDAAASQGKRPSPTWAPRRKGPRVLRIDHILVSGVRVVSAEALPLAGSDHFGVVVDLVDDR
ncbi:MAG: endonuclease/exonuclease/phosphatase family protein, partial [Gemmatimonadetes bacterium]|nr:endonuclease/exonuclease/phosphatase family protein [Gemmatimonadota bacterium]